MHIVIDIEAIGKIILYVFLICFSFKIIVCFLESKFLSKSIEMIKAFLLPPKDKNPTKINYFAWYVFLPIIWIFLIIFVSELGLKK